MPYCNKCGKEISEGQNCSDCQITHLNSKVKKNNWIWGIFIILVIFGASFLVFKNPNVIGGGETTISCPYECCKENSGFLVQPCSNLYKCEESRCIAIDSDGDGLTDIEEGKIGTKINDPNSDKDRYDDGVDPNPLTPNSAKIDLIFISKSWDWKYGNILLSMFGGAIIKPDLVIAEPKTRINIINSGNDYTKFIDFDIVFKVSNTILSQKSIHINKFEEGEEFKETYIQQITAGDIPDLLVNLIREQTNDWSIEIENLNYEKYY